MFDNIKRESINGGGCGTAGVMAGSWLDNAR
jgi:hypothetical protein